MQEEDLPETLLSVADKKAAYSISLLI